MMGRDNPLFDIQYDKEQGYFTISMFNKKIIGSKLLARIGKKEAVLSHVEINSEEDEWGAYEHYILSYKSCVKDKKTFTGYIKIYDKYAVFEVVNHFDIKGKKNKHLFGNPYISFPCFEGDQWEEACSCLSFKRQAPFNYPEQWQGRSIDSLRDGKNSPLMITNKDYETIVISPLNHLLYGTVSINHLEKSIRCGIPRALHIIPKETSYQTILVYGKGVNKTLDNWGSLLRQYHQVKQIEKDADVSLKYISYWTNAGAAYWYNSHKKQSYEDTFHKLKEHHDQIGLTFGSYQLDSWWYKKEGDEYISGITEWEPKMITRSKNFNSMLPFIQKYKNLNLFKNDKISYVQSILEKPIGCHFKQLSNDSVYVEGKEDNYIIEGFPVPKNKAVAKALFTEIFNHPKWKLTYIIHDWLQFMNDNHSAFKDICVAPEYFEALDEACVKTPAPENNSGHLAIQFCMTQPHMTLNSVTMQSVTSIRSTSDSDSFFVEGTKRWWWHMYSSKFIQSLGKYAFYDNRRTSKRPIHPLASFSKFEMIMLALSCGPIGIGDRIGRENMSLIRRVIKEDGEIIKPDVPSSPLDRCYLYNPHTIQSDQGAAIYSYSSIVSKGQLDKYMVYYLLIFNANPLGRKVNMSFSLEEIGASSHKNYAVYDYFSEDMTVISGADINSYLIKNRKFYYRIIAQVENGIAYFGDVSKHISCSNQLIDCIEMSGNSLRVQIKYENKTDGSRFVLYCNNSPKIVLYDGEEQVYTWKNEMLVIYVKRQGGKVSSQEHHVMNVLW